MECSDDELNSNEQEKLNYFTEIEYFEEDVDEQYQINNFFVLNYNYDINIEDQSQDTEKIEIL